MAQYGPNSSGTGADDSTVGTVAWSNPGNVTALDGTSATAALNNATSHYLKATNFGFNIPTGATIYGVQVDYYRSSTTGTATGSSVKIVKGGVITGQEQAASDTWPTTIAKKTYGSGSSLWGTQFTPADINSSGFGVVISANDAGNGTASIDYVSVTVYASAAKDLITQTRAYQALQSVTQGATNDPVVQTLITSVSEAIRKYCKRDFIAQAYDELYDGNGERAILLRQYPIQSVQSVRYRPVTVLKITNNLSANVQARAQVTSTGLTLTRVNGGVKTTDTSVTFAGNVTLSAIATAVNALGNGWSAQTVGDATNYGSWPSADLYVPTSFGDGLSSQGALQCVGGSKMHTYELAGYQFDPRGWLLRAIPYTDPELLHPEDLVFPPGIKNFRVQYTAGYTTIPEGLQEACAEWVAYAYFLAQRDPSIASTSTAPAGGTATSSTYALGGHPPPRIVQLLQQYTRHTVSIQ